SGAVMDLAMDISSGIEEVSRHNPTLPRRELFLSGIRIGRSVVGTMTTTLLLAYSGGYITLLMMFCAQGNSPWDFINNPLVASESVKTLVGSFALVLVAPFTAAIGAWLFRRAEILTLH
ncbi:MAG: YibE/F family protein, partial [Victivallales bacterium]|nr:YibE/F family protein [Victivallales bacterium]